jgi:tetratricopeptide (TPR) repeat protein
MSHGIFALARRERTAAIADAAAADAVLAPEAQARLNLAQFYGTLGDHDKALANYDVWLDHHGNDAIRPVAFNGRCWARFQLNRELDKALSDCNTALRLQPNTAAFLDSRGMVRLRRGENAEAVSDLTAALNMQPNMAMTRYGRGIAEERLGQAEAAKRDKEAALAINPRIAEEASRLGL